MKNKIILSSCFLTIGLASSASAAVTLVGTATESTYTNGAQSSTDLLQTSLDSQDGSASLINGTADPSVTSGRVALTSEVITYSLDLLINTAGYDLTQISVYGGQQLNNHNRNGQDYTVAVSYVSAANTFIDLYSVLDADNEYEQYTQMMTGGGVAAIRFTFGTSGSSPAINAYREIDVFGSPSPIPEPSSTALLGLGGLSLILRRRK